MAQFDGEWTLHYSLVTGMDIPNDRVTVANPYGYVEDLTIDEFLNRTSFEAYEGMSMAGHHERMERVGNLLVRKHAWFAHLAFVRIEGIINSAIHLFEAVLSSELPEFPTHIVYRIEAVAHHPRGSALIELPQKLSLPHLQRVSDGAEIEEIGDGLAVLPLAYRLGRYSHAFSQFFLGHAQLLSAITNQIADAHFPPPETV